MNKKSSVTIIGTVAIILAVAGIMLTITDPKEPSVVVLFVTILIGGMHILYPGSTLLKTGMIVWVSSTCALLAIAIMGLFLGGPDDIMLVYAFVFLLNIALFVVWCRFAPNAYIKGVC